ncbi:LysR family transcriptional regulator [Rhodopseudomonas sp. B29]|uniref:LysR family transcriptional regulator n=1 Tax=Rhodopseudomonas sp. B29 TaxID=95607 RepID=UPI000349A037|nr:LysR family transcriptional regulator [Rhodopseudomonas sp. B29]
MARLGTDLRQTLTLRQLRIFLLAVQTSSASAAARQLGISQPAVSQHIQELEKVLRVRLFERVGIRLLPTAAAVALVDPVRRTLAGIDMIEPSVAIYREAEASYVRIGTGATACIHFLPQPIARTRERNPGIQILVVTGNVNELVKAVEDGGLDLALVTSERLRPSAALEVEPLFPEDFIGILPPSLAYQMPAELCAADLARPPLILFEPGGRTRDITDDWFAAQNIKPIPTMELGSVEAIKTMVGAGLGVSLIPELAASGSSDGFLRRPLMPPLQRHLCLVMRGDKVPDGGLRAFITELKLSAQAFMAHKEPALSPISAD